MAFVYRADRSLDFAKKESKNLGPGSYLGHGEFRPKHLYETLDYPDSTDAPFSSKSQRNFHNLPSFAPGTSSSHPPAGPGQYAPPGQFDSAGKKADQEGKAATSTD